MSFFRDTEVDTVHTSVYIERIAISLKWPKELWTQLLQWKLVGKAQEVYSLSLFENINTVKAAILCVHELVPEAYYQKI